MADPATPVEPHLIVIGFGPLGESVATQYAHLAHYPNGAMPRLTVVTPNAAQDEPRFLARRPHFREACALQFIGCDSASEALGALQVFDAPTPTESRHVVVAGEDDVANLLAGLELLNTRPESVTPVHLRMRDVTGLKELADQAATRGKEAMLVPFGETRDVCSSEIVLDEQLDRLARAVHAQYARGVSARGGDAPPPWEALGEDLREACRRQADHHEIKLRAIGAHLVPASPDGSTGFLFADDELEALAKSEHHRWCAERRLAGWNYAPARDNLRRHHPHLVAWKDLAAPEREKNYEVIRHLPGLMALIGLKITRV